MARTVKHLSLHRIDGTELRVVSDVDTDVLCILSEEETVIRGYIAQGNWPYKLVSLFVLQDLQPLLRQLGQRERVPLEGLQNLAERPVINIYDLHNAESCHIYVNRQVIDKLGYCSDALAIRGLLAHEHAHPLAENETTRASRAVRVEFIPHHGSPQLRQVLAALLDELCVLGPREVFTNELALRCGFGQALFHLDQRVLDGAQRNLAGRATLQRQLLAEAQNGRRTAQDTGVILAVGDMKSHLNLAFEVAPFLRAGLEKQYGDLEQTLQRAILPQLEPEIAAIFWQLVGGYSELSPELSGRELACWAEGIMAIVAAALAERDVMVDYRAVGWEETQHEDTHATEDRA